jgi:hypothetical protein
MSSELKCPYCGTHIDEHEATRCLDAWVANKVLGIYVRKSVDDFGGFLPLMTCETMGSFAGRREEPILYYSGEFLLMEALIDRMCKRLAEFDESVQIIFIDDVVVCNLGITYDPYDVDTVEFWGQAKTAPLAMCRASIKACND